MDFLGNKYFLIGLVIGLALLGGFYIWFDLKDSTNSAVNIATNSTGSTSLPAQTGSPQASSTPAGTPEVKNVPIPALPFPVQVKAELSAEVRERALADIQEIILRLRENPDRQDLWINLGLQRKLIGDFPGAGDAWQYASEIRPKDFIPHNNLGDLYAYDLNDFKKAEEHYRLSIKLEPSVIMVYDKLYELYRFKIKNDAKARAVLEEGIKKNPQTSERLKATLAEWSP